MRVDGFDVFYRESPEPEPGARVMMHVHGFGLSGRYLLPTAQRLSDEFHTLVPDLPGFGRSAKAGALLDVPDLAHTAARFPDAKDVEKAGGDPRWVMSGRCRDDPLDPLLTQRRVNDGEPAQGEGTDELHRLRVRGFEQ